MIAAEVGAGGAAGGWRTRWRAVASAEVSSCEHCRTVTWAGVPACSCEFGRLATDEVRVAVLAGAADGADEEQPGLAT